MGMKARYSVRETIAVITLKESPNPSFRAEQRAMFNVPLFVGLDYHRDSIQVCVLNTEGQMLMNRPCPNDAQAVNQLVAPLGGHIRGAIEACCGAADLADELVGRYGWDLDLAHPIGIKLRNSPASPGR